MMEEKITLDRKTFKVLSSDTRIQILKKLDEHQQTLTDLAVEFDMSPSTVKEHLDKLLEANLIQVIDKGMKWKYYKLTRKGKKILNPYETKVWIILGTALIGLFASMYKFLFSLQNLSQPIIVQYAAERTTEDLSVAQGATEKGVVMLGENIATTTVPVVSTTTTTTIQEIAKNVSQINIPYFEITWILVLVLIAGICTGYLIKKRTKL